MKGTHNKKESLKKENAVLKQSINLNDGGGVMKTDISEKDMSMKVTDTQGHIFESTY